MFERFTERARHVVVCAQEEARELNHDYIGTEHLLLGLLREGGGVGARVLTSQGLELERVRADVARIVRVGEAPPTGQIPFTPRATTVLESAIRAAAGDVGTEHVLLGLIRENEGVAARVLFDFGVDPESIRNEVLRTVPEGGVRDGSGDRTSAAAPEGMPVDPAWLGELGPMLARLAADIRGELGREPDAGDLLLALASMDGALSGRAAGAVGVDVEALAGTVERLRDEASKAGEDRQRALEELIRAKEDAIDAGRFEQAAELRDRERELRAAAATRAGVPADETLEIVRRRLGISPEEPR